MVHMEVKVNLPNHYYYSIYMLTRKVIINFTRFSGVMVRASALSVVGWWLVVQTPAESYRGHGREQHSVEGIPLRG